MPEKPLVDNVTGRGTTGFSLAGTSLFVGLRSLDPLLQHSILSSAPLVYLLPKMNLPFPTPPLNSPIMSFTGLGPIQSLLWYMSIGSSIKQIFHMVFIFKEPFYVPNAFMVAVFNTIFNSTSSLIFTASPPAQFFPYQVYIGAAMYAVGICLETTSEVQRKRFKDRPENTGKAYTGGLFGLARHINYGGYTLWRGGYALAAGGPVWGMLVTMFFAYDFAARGVPVLDKYCSKRYGQQWVKFKEQVPYKLLPGIY